MNYTIDDMVMAINVSKAKGYIFTKEDFAEMIRGPLPGAMRRFWYVYTINKEPLYVRRVQGAYDLEYFLSGCYMPTNGQDESWKDKWVFDGEHSSPGIVEALEKRGAFKNISKDKIRKPIKGVPDQGIRETADNPGTHPNIDIDKRVKVEEDNILIDGEPILSEYDLPYPDKRAETERFLFLGIHGENPFCYPFLEKLIIIDKTDLTWKEIPLYEYIGKNPYGKESALLDLNVVGNSVYAVSEIATVRIHPERIFAREPEMGEVYQTDDNAGLKGMFTYEIIENDGILLRLKPGFKKTDLLRYNGFNASYDTFKIWDLTESTSYMLLLDYETCESKEVSWGSSTTIVSGSYWQRRDGLLQCIKEILPNHPAFREEGYVEVIQQK